MKVSWQANWVWADKTADTSNIYVDFRNIFKMKENLKNVKLHISARNEYNLYVNQKFIGKGPSPCDSQWQYFDTYDISECLTVGLNTIAVVCYSFGTKDIMTSQMQGEAGFILQLETLGKAILTTDETWKYRYSPRWSTKTERISKWGGFKEIYIASQEDDWMFPEYNAESWKNANILFKALNENSTLPRLIPREIPFLHYQRIKPCDIVRVEENFGIIEEASAIINNKTGENTQKTIIDASKPGSMPGILLDFNREVVGWPTFEISAPEGGVLRVAYGESLELLYADSFILKKGMNYLQPFNRRACQFIQLSFSATPKPIVLENFEFESVHYDFKDNAYFHCEDEMLNSIWETSKYTVLTNAHDHLEDCPWREKALWVADAVVMGKAIYSLFGDSLLLKKCLIQGSRIQNEDGSIPGAGPETNSFLLPDFCAYWVLGLVDYFSYSGDKDTLELTWPNIKKLISWFDVQIDDSGLFSRADRDGWWCFIDWTDDVDRRDKVSAVSFLYYKVLRRLSKAANLIDKPEEAEEFGEKAEKLLKCIRERLWLPRKGVFSDCMVGTVLSENISMQTNFLAIWCEIMNAEESEAFLKKYYKNSLLPPIKGPFFQHIVLEVLLNKGMRKEAIDLIKRYWGEMLSRGATTWWETFDESTDHCTIPSTYQGNTPTYLWEAPPVSLCHGWGSSPAYILPQIVLGVDISRLGEGIIILENPTDILTEAKGEFPTKWGTIEVIYKNEGWKMSGCVKVPEKLKVKKPDNYLLMVSQMN